MQSLIASRLTLLVRLWFRTKLIFKTETEDNSGSTLAAQEVETQKVLALPLRKAQKRSMF